jgi:hypothetical protein
MRFLLLYATILPILITGNHIPKAIINKQVPVEKQVLDISPPTGYSRITMGNGVFGAWLRQVNLKKDKTVKLFNGSPKWNQFAQYAVLDKPLGNQDLQQCADAIMRLRAEYLFSKGQFNEILFYDNLGRRYQFQAPHSRTNLEKYLKKIFAWCGTLSLEKQLKHIDDYNDIQAGDVFIHGGSPGHAVIVMDIAANARGEKVFLLAQSYMPAQDIHILKNPSDLKISPWFTLQIEGNLQTPEWEFNFKERKTW